MLHYFDVHLEDRQIEAVVVIHVGINDILRGGSPSSIERLLPKLKKYIFKMYKICCEEYLSYGISVYDQDKYCYFGKKIML